MPVEPRTPIHTKVEQMLMGARVLLPGAQALLGFQYGSERDPCRPESEGALYRSRFHHHSGHARRVRQVSCRRDRKVEQGSEVRGQEQNGARAAHDPNRAIFAPLLATGDKWLCSSYSRLFVR